MSFAYLKERLRNLSWPRARRDRRLLLGLRGERVAARYLRHHHHRVLVRNFRCTAGEIDLICRQGDTLVFVEVKTRTSDVAADPQEAFRPPQWRRIERAARYFLMQSSAQHRPCRFDLVTVFWPPDGSPHIEHFQDAFQPRRA